MKKKMLSLLLAGVFVLTSLTACGGVPNTSVEEETKKEQTEEGKTDSDTKSNTKASGKKVFKYALKSEVPSLDPQLSNSIASGTVGYHIFDGLLRNSEGEIKPALAEKYEMSDDGLTYTFHLREGIKWSDGVEIKAEDFVYGMQRLMNPETASDYAFLGMVLKNGAAVNKGEMAVEELGVSAPDDKTVVIQLEYPAGYFTGMLSMSHFTPVRKDIAEKYGKDFAAKAENNVYAGPFIVKDWKIGDRVILEKNPEYWDADSVKLDGAEVITVAEGNTQLAMFEAGELDYVEVPMDMVASYEDQTTPFYDGSTDYLTLNQDGSSELNNKDLRLALNYALNRDEYIKLATAGVYEANTRFVLPQVHGAQEEYGKEYPYEAYPVTGDKAKAQEHLQAALTELGLSGASEIDLELLVADSENDKKAAEVIQAQLQDNLGITITIKQVPYKQRLEMESKHEFEMVYTGWLPDYSDPYTYLELWLTDGPYNRASYSSEEFDNYLKQASTETDPKARMDLLFEAEKTMCEDAVTVPLQLRRLHMMLNDKVTGFKTYFVGTQYDFIHADIEE